MKHIPDYTNYPPHSLESIAIKINQEEYYLASVHQLKNDDIAELFLIYNTLFIAEKKAREHYFAEFPQLISAKHKVLDSTKELERMLSQYRTLINLGAITDEEKSVYAQINNLGNNQNKAIPNNLPINQKLKLYREVVLIPLIDLLRSHEQIKSLREILLRSYDNLAIYDGYVSRLQNTIDFIVVSGRSIKDMEQRVKPLRQSLDDYISTLPKD